MEANISPMQQFGYQVVAYGLKQLVYDAFVMRTIINNIPGSSNNNDGIIPEFFGTYGWAVNVRLPNKKRVPHNIVPASTPPPASNYSSEFVQITLDYHTGLDFGSTSPQRSQVYEFDSFMQSATKEIINSLVESIQDTILDKMYKASYHVQGDPSTEPFSSNIKLVGKIATALTQNKVSRGNRQIVLSASDYNDAVVSGNFSSYDTTGDMQGVTEGVIQKKIGFTWYELSQAPVHIAGVPGGTVTVDGAHSVDVNIINMDNTGTGNYKHGDILTFSGDTQTYVVTEDVEWTAPGTEPVNINPSKKVALSGGESVTVMDSHKVGLAYPPEAAVFVSRLLPTDDDTIGIFDELNSGIGLNLRQIKGHYLKNLELSVLWGAQVLDPERIIRIVSPID